MQIKSFHFANDGQSSSKMLTYWSRYIKFYVGKTPNFQRCPQVCEGLCGCPHAAQSLCRQSAMQEMLTALALRKKKQKQKNTCYDSSLKEF